METLVCIRLFLVMLFFIHVASLSCDDGDFLDGDHCSKCPYQCQFCESKERCLSCITGFWGSACENSCSRCKDGTSCEKTTGFCLDSCKPGYTGAQCDSNCNEKCSSCDRTNAQTCFNCALGRYPPNSCDKYCPSSCNNQTCNATGYCTTGCRNGSWGQMCEQRCEKNCKESLCLQGNGTCVLGNVDIHTGSNGHERGADLVIVLVVIVVITIIGTVTVVVLYRKKCICKNIRSGPAQRLTNIKIKNKRHSSTIENQDETEQLNKEMTETLVSEASESSSCLKKSAADESVEKTEESSEPKSLQSRLANGIRDCKTLVCCVAAGSKGADGSGNNAPVESNTGTSSETKSWKKRAATAVHTVQTVVSRVTGRGGDVLEKPGDNEVIAEEEEKPPEPVKEVKKKTREEKLREVIEKIKAKTGEMYESEFNGLSKDMPKPRTSSEKKKKQTNVEEEEIIRNEEYKVVVPGKHGDELCASFIKEKVDEKAAYIASAGPITEDGYKCLWRLLFEKGYKTVVMLNTVGKKKKEKYWPDLNKKLKHGSISVKCKDEVVEQRFVSRYFEITEKGKQDSTKTVSQLQYMDWPEKSAPEDVRSLLDFLNKAKDTHPADGGPLVVHGRRGVGRTGTFIALDMLIKDVKDMADSDEEKEIDICSCVRSLRNQRSNMVETIEQYRFLHKALSQSIADMLNDVRKQQTKTTGASYEEDVEGNFKKSCA